MIQFAGIAGNFPKLFLLERVFAGIAGNFPKLFLLEPASMAGICGYCGYCGLIPLNFSYRGSIRGLLGNRVKYPQIPAPGYVRVASSL